MVQATAYKIRFSCYFNDRAHAAGAACARTHEEGAQKVHKVTVIARSKKLTCNALIKTEGRFTLRSIKLFPLFTDIIKLT